MLTLGLDIGGTKIAAGLARFRRRAGAHRHPSHPGRGAADDSLGRRRRDDRRRAARGRRRGQRRSGIASAGPIDLRSGTVSPINIGCWRGFPLRDKVAAVIPGRPACRCGWAATACVWRWASTGLAPGAVRDSCWAWWCPPAWAADWCSTASPTPGAPATPVTSGTWWSNWTVRPARAAAAAASRPSRPARAMVRWARANGWSAPPGAGARDLAVAAAAGDPLALAGVSPGRHRARRDDRLGRRGVRSGPRRHRREGSPSPAPCSSTRCGRRWPSTPGWAFVRPARGAGRARR